MFTSPPSGPDPLPQTANSNARSSCHSPRDAIDWHPNAEIAELEQYAVSLQMKLYTRISAALVTMNIFVIASWTTRKIEVSTSLERRGNEVGLESKNVFAGCFSFSVHR